MWLNITENELKPHADFPGKYRFFKAKTLPSR